MRIPIALALLAPLAAAQERELHPAEALAAAVDLPDRAARQAAAEDLAKRRDVNLEQWLALCTSFGEFEAVEPGPALHTVPLEVEGRSEETRLFVYVPPGYDPAAPAPLLVSLHGTGGDGSGEHLRWRPLADALGCLVLAPSEFGDNRGYTASRRETSSVLAALRWTRRHYNVDERRIFCAGVSRGGHLTWDLALRYPGRFAAIAPMVGGPRLTLQGGQNNLRYAANVVDLSIRDLQGARDDPLMIENLGLLFERLEELGARDAQYIEFPEHGHSFEFGAVDWVQFFGAARREPWPERLTLAQAREDAPGHAWVAIERLDRGVAEEFSLQVSSAWNRWDESRRRRYVAEAAVEHTAHLEVRDEGAGRFEAEGRGVKKFRLLLNEAQLDDRGRVTVEFNGRSKRKQPQRGAEVLLSEFVESFDRGFLPTARVTLP